VLLFSFCVVVILLLLLLPEAISLPATTTSTLEWYFRSLYFYFGDVGCCSYCCCLLFFVGGVLVWSSFQLNSQHYTKMMISRRWCRPTLLLCLVALLASVCQTRCEDPDIERTVPELITSKVVLLCV